MTAAEEVLAATPRVPLATLPTPLEDRGRLSAGQRLLVKRDDLTDLGMGGNKARKLEFIAAQALAEGADLFVTVGAGQSNHARMTAAAGGRHGIETHFGLGGGTPTEVAGNPLLSALFGARSHHRDTDDWDELEAHMGALVVARQELLAQCRAQGVESGVVVPATSSGGTHAGMLAGRALMGGRSILAIAVAKIAGDLGAQAHALADEVLERLGGTRVADADVCVLDAYLGRAYAVPTAAGDDALHRAAPRGWVLDRVYTPKALWGLLGEAEAGRLPNGDADPRTDVPAAQL